MFLVLESRS